MRKSVLLLSVFALMAMMIGCFGVKPATQEEIAKADYGPAPKMKDLEQILRDGLFDSLFDPTSAIFKFHGEPQKGYKRKEKPGATGFSPPDGDIVFGWGGRVQVNAKNRMGAYVGAKWCRYLIKDGKLVGFVEEVIANLHIAIPGLPPLPE